MRSRSSHCDVANVKYRNPAGQIKHYLFIREPWARQLAIRVSLLRSLSGTDVGFSYYFFFNAFLLLRDTFIRLLLALSFSPRFSFLFFSSTDSFFFVVGTKSMSMAPSPRQSSRFSLLPFQRSVLFRPLAVAAVFSPPRDFRIMTEI